MSRASLFLVLAFSSACWGPTGHLGYSGDPPEDDEIWRPNPGDTGPADTGSVFDGPGPVIDFADAWCYYDTDGEAWWALHAIGDDPQGAASLEALVTDAVQAVDAGGNERANLPLACEADGQCWGSAWADNIAVPCVNPENYRFLFSLEDEDGNRSEQKVVAGRYGTSSGG
jgi:hypothetical protein